MNAWSKAPPKNLKQMDMYYSKKDLVKVANILKRRGYKVESRILYGDSMPYRLFTNARYGIDIIYNETGNGELIVLKNK